MSIGMYVSLVVEEKSLESLKLNPSKLDKNMFVVNESVTSFSNLYLNSKIQLSPTVRVPQAWASDRLTPIS